MEIIFDEPTMGNSDAKGPKCDGNYEFLKHLIGISRLNRIHI